MRIIRGPRSALLPILISDQLRHAAAAPKPPAHKARRYHSQVLHLLSLCPAPVNCRDCYFYFSNSVTSTGGYCSNCYTHSIDQSRLPQEIVHICILFVFRSLAHPAPLHPSLVRLHSSFPLSVSVSLSTQCFHDRSARRQLVPAPSEWNLQVGECTVAYSQHKGAIT